ncbi:MAG: SDR family NAD(P)-dependent oxidoreductase, partial [Microbacteriaceae bacterium]|nr:SDR family NAD(P)-dependent oxidoreductase [Microbacteriaceae bacterium]
MSLSGKVAIVTGSGRGLGLAYAQELARQGAAVVVNDVDETAAAEAVASIEALGGKAAAVVAPVGPTETAKQLVATAVETFGRLDILVTNAGVLRDTVLWKMSDEDFDLVTNVHLRGTFTCVREAATYMRENEIAGRIICIGSPTG